MGENKRNEEKNKKNVTGVSVGLGVVVLVYSVVDFCFPWGIIDSTKLTLAEVIAFFGAIITLSLIFRRLKNQEKQLQHQEEQLQKQEKQIKLQIDQRVDDRFTTAVNLLSSNQTSARAGAIYSLYQLAVEDAKYRAQIAQILCSHVRSHTNERKYRKRHKDRPSNEIQTTINLLVRDDNNTRGLYCQDFREKLPRADFNYAYLVGADFSEAQCQRANFTKARCQGADFSRAWCKNADFSKARCQRADFLHAKCQRTDFSEAQCQGAGFYEAQCQGANFVKVQFQGVFFYGAQCQGASFYEAQCQGVGFYGGQFQGAGFYGAQCQGASFNDAQCLGADFSKAHCQGASFYEAQCQGASFYEAQCQGAYVAEVHKFLNDRIGKPTELENMIMAGKISEEGIQGIEGAKEYCSEGWYAEMQEIIERNEGREEKRGVPKGIIDGILEDSEEIQAIISEDWEKLKAIQMRQMERRMKKQMERWMERKRDE